MRTETLLDTACMYARRKDDRRTFKLAAIGVRADGAVVHAVNQPTTDVNPTCHAEWRLCQKLDKGATVYVARVGADGVARLARPCPACRSKLMRQGVVRVYYSIGPHEYGVIDL